DRARQAHCESLAHFALGVLAYVDLLPAGPVVDRLAHNPPPWIHEHHRRQSRHPARRVRRRIKITDSLVAETSAPHYNRADRNCARTGADNIASWLVIPDHPESPCTT